MKVLLLNGGPHKEGCTYTALSEVAATLQVAGVETEIVWLGVKPVAGCIGCGSCAEKKACFRDDMVNEFLDKAAEADGFVFGSPVHFASASGAITSFMDRAFYAGNRRGVFAGKPAAAIASCRRGGATATFDQLNKYFRQDLEGLQTMRTLGRNMAWLLRCIEAGRQAGIDFPRGAEEPLRTNFIR